MTLEFDAKGVDDILFRNFYKLSDPCIEALIRKTAVGKEYFLKLSGLSLQNLHYRLKIINF